MKTILLLLKQFFCHHDYELKGDGALEYQKGNREKFVFTGKYWVCKKCGKERVKLENRRVG